MGECETREGERGEDRSFGEEVATERDRLGEEGRGWEEAGGEGGKKGWRL